MVKIITDTTSVIPRQVAERYHIPVIPQIINFEDGSYYEGVDIDLPAFLQKLSQSKNLPSTAAPPPELFIEEINRIPKSEDPILCIHPSSEVSGTVRSATVAARDFPDREIHVIDSRVIGSPLATMVELAAKWAHDGKTADFILAQLNGMIPRCRLYFLVDTLDYLAKGGRIGGASHLVGSLLNIKPILCLRDGKVEAFEKERTYRRAVERLQEIACEQVAGQKEAYLSLMYAGSEEQCKQISLNLSQKLNLPEVPLYSMPPAIITHGGPGILGVAFFTEN